MAVTPLIATTIPNNPQPTTLVANAMGTKVASTANVAGVKMRFLAVLAAVLGPIIDNLCGCDKGCNSTFNSLR